MYKRYITAITILLSTHLGIAQQFIGMPNTEYTGIQQVPYNPAFINNSRSGLEVNVFGASIFAANNAYGVNSRMLFNPAADTNAVEGKDYFRLRNSQYKKAWVNADILGPAVSFTYKKKYQFGIYTRFRTIVNAGKVKDTLFDVLTNEKNPYYYFYTAQFDKTGASAHMFGEIGITAGQMLHDDEYYKLSAGVTVKYLMGFAAMSVYTKSLGYKRDNDSIGYIKGDLTALYTYNTNPSSISDLTQRAGKGSLGLDLGMHYEFYDDQDPNKKTNYRFALSAAITDIGSVSYVADKGSALYDVKTGATEVHDISLEDQDKDEFTLFTARKIADASLTVKKKYEKFNIGLPTAFRASADYNFGEHVFLQANTLINLRGNNGKVYHPGYASYINITPRYDHGNVKIGMPITFIRFRTFALGTVFNLGPFYLGSTTSLSSILLGSNISNIDVYTGLTLKISNAEKKAREFTYDYRGYDDPNRGLRKLIPGFLKRRDYRY